jgi:hypothetical protein
MLTVSTRPLNRTGLEKVTQAGVFANALTNLPRMRIRRLQGGHESIKSQTSRGLTTDLSKQSHRLKEKGRD